ncbi:uncharacterized protein LOC118477445 [Aplysia californica]|uniref:Uncharacterized protein LOC118477445 n=1 Tax=Aplysia californica TaxID=6500 RepID=A0ABM1VR04_APLCA|nr:uncharacterized protein LOC118477445 [Aplysia californica]
MPVSLLSCEYLVVTESVHLSSFLLVVNSEGFNDVTIEFAFEPADSSINYKNTITFYSGQSLRESLESLDVLQILGEGADLTGTWVRAQRPVAVIAGASFDCVFMGNEKCKFRDMLIEQLPPVSDLGQDYVLTPFSNENKVSFVKIVYVTPSTTFSGLEHIQMKESTSRNTSTFLYFQVEAHTITHLHASDPVLIVQFVLPPFNETILFDLSATVLYPISKWVNRAEILTFDDNNYEMIIIASCLCIHEIQIGVDITELNTLSEPEDEGGTSRYCSKEILISSNDLENKIEVNGESCPFTGSIINVKRSVSGWAVPLVNFHYRVDEVSPSPTPLVRVNLCPCSCPRAFYTHRDMLNRTALSSEIAAIQSYLYVLKEDLSKTVRSKTSATDDRPSSTAVGFLVFVCTFFPIFGSLVLCDLYKALCWLYH